MRVLFLINAFAEDGPGLALKSLLPRLNGRRIDENRTLEVEVAALRTASSPLLRDHFERAGLTCRQIDVGGFDFLGVRAVARLLSGEGASAPFDALVTSLIRPDLVGRAAAKRRRPSKTLEGRVYSIEHGVHAWGEKGGAFSQAVRWWVRRSYLRSMSGVKAVACVSLHERHQLADEGVDPKKLRVIHNSIDTDVYRRAGEIDRAEARRRFGLPEDAVVIGCAGGLNQWKGQLVLLGALHKINSGDIPIPSGGPIHMALLGAGPRLDFYRQYVANNELEENVTFIAPIPHDETPTFYRALDIYCQPSLSESFGVALAEAMASGLPSAISRVGGMLEFFSEDFGRIVDPSDSIALGEALRELIVLPPDQREKIGAGAAEYARNKLDVEQRVEEWVSLFRD